MKVALGKVVSGNVVVEGERLDEGATVTLLVRESDDEGFDVTPDQKKELLASIAQADRGELKDAEDVLSRLS